MGLTFQSLFFCLALCALALPARADTALAARDALRATARDVFTVQAADDSTLYVRQWPQSGARRASVLVIHGIGFDAAPYKVVADHLSPRGIAVFALDLRNHGLSDGRRGFLASVETNAADIRAALAAIRRGAPDRPLFLLGESLGGLEALGAAALLPETDRGLIDGLILVAPALAPNSKQWLGPGLVVFSLMAATRPHSPSVSLIERLQFASRDTAFLVLRRTDPLGQTAVTPAYMLQYMSDASRWRKQWAGRITWPLLVQQGERDMVVVPWVSRGFAAQTPSRDTTTLSYPDAFHTLFWDPLTPRVLADMGDWILEHSR